MVYAAALILVLVVPVAFAQTYETPQTLSVVLMPPFYTYTDMHGHTVTTGLVHNESAISYVGNVMILAKFYGDSFAAPLDIVSGHTLLEVIPPGGSSPYVVRTTYADPRIDWATSSLLIFDAANPKLRGLDMQGPRHNVIQISDVIGAPHGNVTIHLAYHDAFDPPRILETDTYHVGIMGAGQSLNFTLPDYAPPDARSMAAYVESDTFSGEAISWNVVAPPPQTPLPAYILDAWLADRTWERTTTPPANQNVTLNAAINMVECAGCWLYVQVTDRATGEVAFLERVGIAGGLTSIPWTTPASGEYIMEMFLWEESGVPVSRPGPALPFSVG